MLNTREPGGLLQHPASLIFQDAFEQKLIRTAQCVQEYTWGQTGDKFKGNRWIISSTSYHASYVETHMYLFFF